MIKNIKIKNIILTKLITLFSIFFIVTLVNCTQKKTLAEEKKDLSKYYITNCDTIPIRLIQFRNIPLNQLHRFRTILKKTPIYCSPSKQSNVIGEIDFNKKLRVLKQCVRYYESKEETTNKRERRNHKNKDRWYKIKNGFISEEDTGLFLSENLILSKKDSKLITYSHNQIIDTLKPHCVDLTFENKVLYDSALANKENNLKQIVLFHKQSSSCPGASFYKIIGITNDYKIDEIISGSFISGEGVSEDEFEKIYLPSKLYNGKILLVENGDFDNIFNRANGTLNTFEYPNQIKIPIEELFVKKYSNGDIKYYQYKNNNLKQIKF